MPIGIEDNASFLDYFLREVEKVSAMMQRYAEPEQVRHAHLTSLKIPTHT